MPCWTPVRARSARRFSTRTRRSNITCPGNFTAARRGSATVSSSKSNLQAFSSIDAYPLISTDSPTLIYGDAGANQPPAVISRPFPSLTSASDGVVNVSTGGHLRLFANRDMRIHAGVGNNQSPVAAADTVFSHVDLLTWTLGVSGSLGRFQFSAGFNRQSGTTSDITLRNLLNGQVVESTMDVSMGGFIYSLAYQF